jgi:hypothetical protein
MSNLVIEALNSLSPGAAWSIRTEDDGAWKLEWHDKVIAQPADDVLLAEIARLSSPEEVTKRAFAAAIDKIEVALQNAMEAAAKKVGYDSLLSACSYAAQVAGAPFQAEGAAFLAWRSEVWAASYARLNEIKAKQGALPTPEEAVAQMPNLELP